MAWRGDAARPGASATHLVEAPKFDYLCASLVREDAGDVLAAIYWDLAGNAPRIEQCAPAPGRASYLWRACSGWREVQIRFGLALPGGMLLHSVGALEVAGPPANAAHRLWLRQRGRGNAKRVDSAIDLWPLHAESSARLDAALGALLERHSLAAEEVADPETGKATIYVYQPSARARHWSKAKTLLRIYERPDGGPLRFELQCRANGPGPVRRAALCGEEGAERLWSTKAWAAGVFEMLAGRAPRQAPAPSRHERERRASAERRRKERACVAARHLHAAAAHAAHAAQRFDDDCVELGLRGAIVAHGDEMMGTHDEFTQARDELARLLRKRPADDPNGAGTGKLAIPRWLASRVPSVDTRFSQACITHHFQAS